ncbi:hillarin [Lingula anatina]|uniref:Hillarin n=1 Tax=Lingula anatina TaxID=7574 RepID=A0A1S3IQE6_LINAN|nr:hillarin [Lingula anatina]|eukprot:XP_013400445.1 hillarin [Lingula anatina]
MKKLVEEIMAEKETSVKEFVALLYRLGMKSSSRIIKGTPLVWKGAPKSAADDRGAEDDDDDDVITDGQNLDDEAFEGDTSATSLLEKSKHIDDEYQSRLDERMQELMRSLEQQEQEELAKLERAIDTENDFNRSLPPDVAPPEVKKMDFFEKSDSAVQRLDMQAIEVAKSDDLTTFTDLVRNLTKDCCNELEKARAIFRWITVKNLNKMEFSDDLDPDTPLGLLRGIKLGIESYHVLFKRLCSYAGIHCEIIRGYSKGSGYKAGRKMSRRFRNSWTAVCVDGSWHFINCQWGARFTRGKHFEDELGQGQITSPGQGQGNVINEELQYRCEEFYFLTDPEDHIFEHFPDDKKWQLMEPAISMEEFIRLPVVKAPFFNKGLRFATRYISILWTHSGRAEVRIGVPNASRADFAAKIDPHHPPSAASRESGTGSVLCRRIDNEVLFTAKVPQPGIYFLKIFVADDPSTTMECACVFQINCTDVDKSSSRRHYPNVHILGATAHAKGLGISPVARFDPYVVHDKESDYCFRILTKRNCRISHTFVYFGKSVSSALENTQFAMIYEKDPDHVGFRLRMIKNGFYMLSVFAAELDLNVSQISVSQSAVEDQFECVYRVLVRCSVPSMEQCPLPIALGRWDVGVLVSTRSYTAAGRK